MSQIYVNTITPLGGTSGTITVNSNLTVNGSVVFDSITPSSGSTGTFTVDSNLYVGGTATVDTLISTGGTSGTLTIDSNLTVTGSTDSPTLIISNAGGTSDGGIIISATGGAVVIQGIGTTSAGLPSGALWNDNGYLRLKP
jgi:hypothetical protein